MGCDNGTTGGGNGGGGPRVIAEEHRGTYRIELTSGIYFLYFSENKVEYWVENHDNVVVGNRIEFINAYTLPPGPGRPRTQVWGNFPGQPKELLGFFEEHEYFIVSSRYIIGITGIGFIGPMENM